MRSTSSIQLSKKALQSNLRFFKRQFGKEVRISSVIKGNAYGHGIEEYSQLAMDCGIDHFSVFSVDEAYRLWNASEVKPEIMIMGYIDEEGMLWAMENGIEFWVFNIERLEAAIALAKSSGLVAKIHVEIETGMHRTGLEKKEWAKFKRIYSKNTDQVQLKGICTHFAGAESISNFVRIQDQKKRFREALSWFRRQGIHPEYRHACCSAAAIRYPDMLFDMVRIGILQYGFWPSREIFIEFLKHRKDKSSPIHRLMTWKSKVMSIKEVDSGEFIGYGTSFFTGRKTRLAIVPLGYSGGFIRALSNAGRVLIRGKRVGVVGTVNMNSLTVDITELKEVNLGDEVIIVGRQGKLELTVAAFTELSQQLNYEALTRIPENIERTIV